MTRHSILWILGLGLLGCSSGSGGEGDTVDDQPGVKVSGILTEATFGVGSGVAIDGAEVCMRDMPEVACVTTDVNGAFTLIGLPEDTEDALVVTKQGYLDVLAPISIGMDDQQLDSLRMVEENLGKAFSGSAGFGWPMGDTMCTLTVSFIDSAGNPVAGAMADLNPRSGVGPVYTSVDGEPLGNDALRTSDSGIAVYGDVSDGMIYQLTALHPDRDCRMGSYGWEASTDDRLKTEVMANSFTEVTFICD